MHVRAARWIMARSQPAFHLELARGGACETRIVEGTRPATARAAG